MSTKNDNMPPFHKHGASAAHGTVDIEWQYHSFSAPNTTTHPPRNRTSLSSAAKSRSPLLIEGGILAATHARNAAYGTGGQSGGIFHLPPPQNRSA